MGSVDVCNYEIEKMIYRDVPLAPFSTMRVGGAAQYFARVKSEKHLVGLVRWSQQRCLPLLVLGDGSNVVISDRGVTGLVIRMEIPGVMCLEDSDNAVAIEVGAGECWDSFVEYTIRKGWWGIENMSLIPGTVGAVAVQNVSAYGQEARNVIHCVRAYNVYAREFATLSCDQCCFGFRKSIFNTSESGRYIIVSIVFKLLKNGKPSLTRREVVNLLQRRRLSSSTVTEQPFLKLRGLVGTKNVIVDYTQREIRDAIIHLRTRGGLLPTPNSVGNSGTFFRATVVSHAQFKQIALRCILRLKFVLLIQLIACRWFLSSSEGVKISSKILIRECKLQNLARGEISLLATNCAVLINSADNSSTSDILEIIRIVRRAIYRKIGIAVPIEPTLVGFSAIEIKRAFDLLR